MTSAFVRGYEISEKKAAAILEPTGRPEPTADETLDCFLKLVPRKAYFKIAIGYPLGMAQEKMVHIVVIDEGYDPKELGERVFPTLHPDLQSMIGILDGPMIFDIIT